jgi:predicted metal-dependent HD superfamily phosphohydrolase
MADLNKLASEWKELTGNYSQNSKLIERTFNKIAKNYSASKRHYHNLDHVEMMLQTAADWKDKVEDYDAIRFAIWFHDVVYKSLKDNNEDKSARFATKALQKLEFPRERAQVVSDLIMKTKTHMVRGENESFDLQLFLDIDLMILGSEFEKYKRYTLQIQKEYRLVPQRVYKPGRKKLLMYFLSVPEIYRTEAFKVQYEQQARENIKKEIEVLSA